MPTLDDYLRLDLASARRQWNAIVARAPVEPGRRQVDFTPVREARDDPAARAAFGRPPLAERLLLPRGAASPRDEYLRWHRANVYRGEPADG